MQNGKPILLVDFDGVIHSYTSGWKGANVVSDPPVPGAREFLHQALEHFKVMIYSSRSRQEGGVFAMQLWMNRNDINPTAFEFPTEKPAAFLTIDDRAVCFEGTFPDARTLLDFKPWNKR